VYVIITVSVLLVAFLFIVKSAFINNTAPSIASSLYFVCSPSKVISIVLPFNFEDLIFNSSSYIKDIEFTLMFSIFSGN